MEGLQKTLPASWYCSKPIYELERQSVFLPAWHLLGPVTRYADERKVQYELAGVHFVVERLDDENKDRSFRVTDLASDQALPHKLTRTGLLFVALSQDVPSFEDYYPGLEALTDRFDFTELPFRRTLSYKGRFNWKTMVDGYQECLHCQYTHRAFSALYPPEPYAVQNHGHYSRHLADPAKPLDDGLFLYFFPCCTLNRYGGGMTSFRVCPSPEGDGPEVTRMEFDYYNSSDGEAFEDYFKFVRRVAMEDYELCETVQGNLAKGVYSRGVLNPDKENGVAHYQGLVRDRVVGEFRKRQKQQQNQEKTVADVDGKADAKRDLVLSSSRVVGGSVLV
ncbi:uncharacterized protein PG986_002610 [Apiospora aurea]|uniref:Choline monooxygenase, chloroplastic n=1 Tax=Apiospora aurea TaxID=335848 RepID=A0ABR1QPC7_9PEZI